jgi:hypothetical protein
MAKSIAQRVREHRARKRAAREAEIAARLRASGATAPAPEPKPPEAPRDASTGRFLPKTCRDAEGRVWERSGRSWIHYGRDGLLVAGSVPARSLQPWQPGWFDR